MTRPERTGSRRFRSPSLSTLLIALPLFMAGAACSGDGGEGGPAADGGEAGSAVALTLDGSYAEPFSYLSSVREMPDGTVMAADPLGQVLLRLDMNAQSADTLGRVGEGPEEYEQPDQVYPLPGDSTLLVDLGNGRLTTLDPEGRFVDGMPIAQQTDSEGGGMMGMTVLMPRALDGRGRIYFSSTRGMDADPPDSTYVVRFDRATQALDTVAALWVPELQVERSGNNIRISNVQLQGQDDWAVGPDGSIAVVHRNGYSVAWIHPDGRVTQGPTPPFDEISPSQADKDAIVDERAATGLAVMMTAGGEGGMSMAMRRGGTPRFAGADDMPEQEWAEVFPPFREGASAVSPAGELWVERWGHTTDPRLFDVFDGQGVRIATVELPAGSRIIGFGDAGGARDVVYVTRMDEVGLWWLERYRIDR